MERHLDMSNGYKQALARFEKAVRDHAFRGTLLNIAEREDVEREYEDAKRHLVQKLQYRQLAAEERVRQERES